jgi:hypothetical protein
VVLSLARTGTGALAAISFSGPLVVAATNLSAPLVAVAGGGFVSLMRWEFWGTGCTGLEGASGGFVAGAKSCATRVLAGASGVILAVVLDRKPPQPARQSESAARNTALATAARGEPEADRSVAIGDNSERHNWVRQGFRSSASTEMPFPRAGTTPACFRAFESALALMSSSMTYRLFKPTIIASHRSTGSPQDLQEHCMGQSQPCKRSREEHAKWHCIPAGLD